MNFVELCYLFLKHPRFTVRCSSLFHLRTNDDLNWLISVAGPILVQNHHALYKLTPRHLQKENQIKIECSEDPPTRTMLVKPTIHSKAC